MVRRARPKIPLRSRLPNPSPLFVGREHEVEALAVILERSPVALVRGPGGIGKTSLALHTLIQRYPKQRSRAVFVPIPPDEPPDQVRLSLAQVLLDCSGAGDAVDIPSMRGDPEELVAAALDLAEEGSHWVLIDDLQHSDASEMAELVRQLSAYARDSRWIITTRATGAHPDLEGCVLDLDKLAPSALAELARTLDAKRAPGDLQAAITASAGSPWRLKQYLAVGPSAVDDESIVGALSKPSREFLRTLTLLEAPLPNDALAAVVAMPDETALTSLENRGLIVRDGSGLRVHGQVADLLFGGARNEPQHVERRLEIARALAARTEPDALLQALRLFHQLGNLDAMVELLDGVAHELLGLGFAPRIWAAIGASSDPRLSLWKLRCAAELGNSTVLAAVGTPSLSDDRDQLAWAATQYLVGEPAEARRLAKDLESRAANQDTATAAALLAARCALRLGHASEAEEELSRHSPSGAHRLGHDALLARVGACLDRPGADAQAAAVLARADGGVDPEVLLDLAGAFLRSGDRGRADATIDRVLTSPRGGRASLLVARRAMLLRARIQLSRGDTVECERLLELVRPYARGASILRPLLIELDTERRMSIGDLDGLDASVQRGLELAQHADSACASRLQQLRRELRRRHAKPLAEPEGGGSLWEPTSSRRLREDLSALHACRLESEPTDLLEEARRIARDAHSLGLRLIEADAELVVADVLLSELNSEALTKSAQRLETLAETLGAARLLDHAAFHEHHRDIAVLERLASQMHSAPIIARRARALLGETVLLDATDERAVAAARTEWLGRTVVRLRDVEGAEWTPAWGLDHSRAAVWFPDGRTLPLDKKPLLWRVLITLAERGGEASKEQLINRAWGEPHYHALRHDAKLHVAIRTLRRLIETDPSNPTRLLTFADGYRLGGAVRQVLLEG